MQPQRSKTRTMFSALLIKTSNSLVLVFETSVASVAVTCNENDPGANGVPLNPTVNALDTASGVPAGNETVMPFVLKLTISPPFDTVVAPGGIVLNAQKTVAPELVTPIVDAGMAAPKLKAKLCLG